MLAGISARRWAEWEVYLSEIHGPLGDERADIRAALIACTVANAFRGKGKAAKLTDFLLAWDAGKQKAKGRRQTPQQMIAIAKAIAIAFGGEITNSKQQTAGSDQPEKPAAPADR